MFAKSILFKRPSVAHLVFIDDPPQILESHKVLLSHEETEFTRICNFVAICK